MQGSNTNQHWLVPASTHLGACAIEATVEAHQCHEGIHHPWVQDVIIAPELQGCPQGCLNLCQSRCIRMITTSTSLTGTTACAAHASAPRCLLKSLQGSRVQLHAGWGMPWGGRLQGWLDGQRESESSVLNVGVGLSNFLKAHTCPEYSCWCASMQKW
jgi:hypothetical protein